VLHDLRFIDHPITCRSEHARDGRKR